MLEKRPQRRLVLAVPARRTESKGRRAGPKHQARRERRPWPLGGLKAVRMTGVEREHPGAGRQSEAEAWRDWRAVELVIAKHKVATPANWEQGGDVIIMASVSDQDAKKKFPEGWKSPLPYMRVARQPDA